MTTHTIHVRNMKLDDHIVHFGQLYRVIAIGTFPKGLMRVFLELVEDNDVTTDFTLHQDETVVITILDN